MDRVEWDPAFETGHVTVDEQHRAMIGLFNALLDADKRDGSLVPEVLDRLVLHVGTHFTSEEQLMRECGIPAAEVAEHVTEHEKLTAYVRDRVMEYRVGELQSIGPLVEFLSDWLGEHILGNDRALADYLRSCG